MNWTARAVYRLADMHDLQAERALLRRYGPKINLIAARLS